MAQRNDDDIANDVNAELDANGLPLGVEVEAGTVRLSGEVTSEAERQAAIDLANWVEGVNEVQDDLTVIEFIANPAAIDEIFIDDEFEDMTDDPRTAASEGLAYIPPTDPPIVPDDDQPGYEVRGGFATTALEDQPEDAPQGTSELLDRVRQELAEDSRTSGLRLSVAARFGTIVLRGRVEDRASSRAAAEVAGRVDGVEQVIDRTIVARQIEAQPTNEPAASAQPATAHVITASAAWRAIVSTNSRRLRQMREETVQQIEEFDEAIFDLGEDQEQEGAGSSHNADLAADVDSAGRMQAQKDAAQHRLAEIDEALDRVQQGLYGICVDTGQLIDPERLRANPMAIRTLAAQERYEQEADRP